MIRLSPIHNLSDLVQTLKTASTKWLKQKSPDFRNFSWQSGFGAFSVSKSQTDVVKEYIRNQKEHHKIRGFDEEWINFHTSTRNLLSLKVIRDIIFSNLPFFINFITI